MRVRVNPMPTRLKASSDSLKPTNSMCVVISSACEWDVCRKRCEEEV